MESSSRARAETEERSAVSSSLARAEERRPVSSSLACAQADERSAVSSSLARAERRRLLALWGGILVPPAAWSVHLLLGYLLVTLACQANWGSPVLALLLNGQTLVLGALTVASAVLAWRAGREHDAGGDASAAARERRAFMVHVGIALGALFLLLILAGDVPNLFVPPCGYRG